MTTEKVHPAKMIAYITSIGWMHFWESDDVSVLTRHQQEHIIPTEKVHPAKWFLI
jgi:hypothetical protein